MIKYFKSIDWLKLAKLTWILMAIYIAFTFSICLFKYFTYRYNALDLAIFNQVFYNTSMGRLFQFSIHPTLYLGDHFKPMILLLTPFYSIYRSPLMLLLLQSLFLALAAIPLYLICKKHLTPLLSTLVIILYLFNPVTLDINLFEYHLLPMAVFFLLWAFYFYDQNKFKPFLAFIILSLLIREDVSFVVFMFGVIAIFDKKKTKWVLTPIILSTIYFFIALKVIAFFSASSSYKFLVYYQWLGDTPKQMLFNLFFKFPLVINHLFTLANFELILGFLLVFLFLPIIKPKYILLSLGQFAEIFLGFVSGEIIMRSHYGTIFLFAFTIATIFSIKSLASNNKALNFYKNNKDVVVIIIVIILMYNFLVLGPFIPFVKAIANTNYDQVRIKNEFSKQIPDNGSLITGYDFITNLSSRQKLYSLNYAFLGKKQYNAGDYIIPDDTQYLLLNFYDFVGFNLQYKVSVPKYYYKGDENMRKLLEDKNLHLKMIYKNIGLWEKDYEDKSPLLYEVYENKKPDIKNRQDKTLTDQLKFMGFNQDKDVLSLFFLATQKMEDNYMIKINQDTFMLGYGFYPTSRWEINKIVQMNFYGYTNVNTLKITDLKGGYEIDGIGSSKDVIDNENILAEFSLTLP